MSCWVCGWHCEGWRWDGQVGQGGSKAAECVKQGRHVRLLLLCDIRPQPVMQGRTPLDIAGQCSRETHQALLRVIGADAPAGGDAPDAATRRPKRRRH